MSLIYYKTPIFLTGWKRTGKDSFAKQLLDNKIHNHWKIYMIKKINFPQGPYIIRSIAKPLKDDVSKRLGFSITDENKDKLIQYQSIKLTPRELLIKVAKEEKLRDPYIYIKRLLKEQSLTKRIIITDWRFFEEYNCFLEYGNQPITCRLYRSEVPIPKEQEEHYLDNQITDIIALGLNDKIEDFLELFPQYKSYSDFLFTQTITYSI